ncbi:MAG TPA: response regulator [Magnetospirillum sp.]|nr:response regulator [Magnetospirillum sp.]
MRSDSGTKRILVIEDEVMVAMGIEMALADAGYEVVGPFGRLDQALDAARNGQMDVALLDVNVRGEAIFPVADILAARGIPFVFLTGYGRETLPIGFKAGRVLSKPFQPLALLSTVKSMCS